MSSMEIPYTVEPRPDTGLTSGKIGIWLFLASEVMLFGALFATYILLRVGAVEWPHGAHYLNIPLATLNTVFLISSSVTMYGGITYTVRPRGRSRRPAASASAKYQRAKSARAVSTSQAKIMPRWRKPRTLGWPATGARHCAQRAARPRLAATTSSSRRATSSSSIARPCR